jgi:hypothetical protein
VPELLRVEINCVVLGSGAVVSGQSSTTNREFSGRKYSPKLWPSPTPPLAYSRGSPTSNPSLSVSTSRCKEGAVATSCQPSTGMFVYLFLALNHHPPAYPEQIFSAVEWIHIVSAVLCIPYLWLMFNTSLSNIYLLKNTRFGSFKFNLNSWGISMKNMSFVLHF